MNTQMTKQAMATAAHNLGFELVHADLRSGCFHVKRGNEIRMGHVWRRITLADIATHVKLICNYGDKVTPTH